MVLCCFILLFVISLRRNFKVSYLETVQLQGYGYLLLGQEKFRVPKNRQTKRRIWINLACCASELF